jgi:menaquinone-dependent protoporphyrinogen oxidase
MRILVIYASKYGATQGIAQRIAHTLTEGGHDARAVSTGSAADLGGYDAFVVGSAAYMGSWLKRAGKFVRQNAATLSARPVWLFSSGPLGAEATPPDGIDQRKAAEPKEFAEFQEVLHPRGTRVFFGAFDHTQLTVRDRLVYLIPAVRKILPDGDFRDTQDIDAWARGIAAALTPAAAA